MVWWRYRLLLKAMVVAGIVERGYYRASVKRKATFLRKPGEYKPGRPGPCSSSDDTTFASSSGAGARSFTGFRFPYFDFLIGPKSTL